MWSFMSTLGGTLKIHPPCIIKLAWFISSRFKGREEKRPWERGWASSGENWRLRKYEINFVDDRKMWTNTGQVLDHGLGPGTSNETYGHNFKTPAPRGNWWLALLMTFYLKSFITIFLVIVLKKRHTNVRKIYSVSLTDVPLVQAITLTILNTSSLNAKFIQAT